MIRIVHETDAPIAAREALLDDAIGKDRKSKTAYRLRDGVPEISELSFSAYDDDRLVGTIRFWPAQVTAPGTVEPIPILILGPLAVAPDIEGQGIGLDLMKTGLKRAEELGHKIVILVGDLPYYSRVGFHREGAKDLQLPGPVDPDRLLLVELEDGAALGLAGMVTKAQQDHQSGAVAQSRLARNKMAG